MNSQLLAYVVTKDWSTSSFLICKGVIRIHIVKGFVDNSTAISPFHRPLRTQASTPRLNPVRHRSGPHSDPPPCVSFIYNGKRVDKQTTFNLGDRKTRNIATGPTRLRAKCWATSLPPQHRRLESTSPLNSADC